jgi:hypothetical protein
MSGALGWQQEQCFVKSGRRYCLLHSAVLTQAGKARTFRRWIEKATRAGS